MHDHSNTAQLDNCIEEIQGLVYIYLGVGGIGNFDRQKRPLPGGSISNQHGSVVSPAKQVY